VALQNKRGNRKETGRVAMKTKWENKKGYPAV